MKTLALMTIALFGVYGAFSQVKVTGVSTHYINATTATSYSAGGATGPAASGLTGVGRGWYGNGPVDFNHAAIDDIRFYASALTAADVYKVALVGNPA